MSRFHDEGYYDRHWDQCEQEEEECNCYWLAGGDDNAEVECGHCARRRRESEDEGEGEGEGEGDWHTQCDVVRAYLARQAGLADEDSRADNFAQLMNYLIQEREFMDANPVFRDAVRRKALEYRDHPDVSFICRRILAALDRA